MEKLRNQYKLESGILMRKLYLSVVLLIIVGMFSGCQDEAAPVEMNVAYLSGPTALTILQVAHDNPVVAENVTVNYEMIPATDVMMGKLTAGELDIAVIATNQAAMLYNKGIEYQIAAPSVWGVLYMLGTEEISNFQTLAGKEIALIGQGLTPDIMLRHLLTQNGLNPDEDVTLTYLSGPEELLQSMISGRYELAVIPEPLSTVAQIKNTNLKVVLDFQQEWQNLTGQSSYPMSSLVVRKAFADEHPEIVNSFLNLYSQSITWANDNPAALGSYAEEMEIGLTSAIVQKSLPACNLSYKTAAEAKEEIESFLQALNDIIPDAIGGNMPDEGFYYNGQ